MQTIWIGRKVLLKHSLVWIQIINCHILLHFFELVMTIFYVQLYNSCWYSICYGFPVSNLLHTLIQLSCSLLMESAASKSKRHCEYIHGIITFVSEWPKAHSHRFTKGPESPRPRFQWFCVFRYRFQTLCGLLNLLVAWKLDGLVFWGADVMKDLEVLIFRLPKWQDDN